jgi:serine/threonine protein kinase
MEMIAACHGIDDIVKRLLAIRINDYQVYKEINEIPFSVVKLLGRGAFGHVEMVRWTYGPFVGRFSARKTFWLQGDDSERKMQQAAIEREANIIRGARHTHVLRGIGTYICERLYAIIMDPVAEGNPEEYLNHVDSMPLDNTEQTLRDQLSQWFGCLINGLAYIHAQDIHHRDIKPQNILTLKGNILLTDFGTSKIFPDGTILGWTETRGTPLYRAPEFAEGRQPCRRADVFSLGLYFWRCLLFISVINYSRGSNAFGSPMAIGHTLATLTKYSNGSAT